LATAVAHPIDLLAYTQQTCERRREAMSDTAEQDDANRQRPSDPVVAQGRVGVVEIQGQTRTQAALVRESLVRCPGAE
jgi:hypothetical protein